MSKLGSILRCLCMSLTLCAGAALYAVYYIYEVFDKGELFLDKAPGVVSIVREADTQIMHIRGDSWASISYGQGFVCAQTRLWQMEKQRRVAKGKLSELFGEKALPIDEFMRMLGLEKVTQESWNKEQDLDIRDMLTSYADGVNDYVKGISLSGYDEQHKQTARVLPPEFIAFGITKDNFEPWTPVDSMIMFRLISFHLTWNWARDLQNEAMRQMHPFLAEIQDEIMPFTSDRLYDMVPIVDDDDLKQWDQYSDESLVDKYRASFEHISRASPPLSYEKDVFDQSEDIRAYREKLESSYLGSDGPILGEQMQSNNFVVHGEHTATGMPLLASDPHLDCSIPSAWTLYSLEWPDGRILSGAQLPGVPAMGIGRTNHITWGLTTPCIDTSDLWQEKLNEDETEYFVDNEWRKLEIYNEVFKIKDQPDKIVQIKKTHRGPVASSELFRINSALLFGGKSPSIKKPGHYSFSWHGQQHQDDTMKMMKKIYDAKDLPSLFETLDSDQFDTYFGFGQNALLADTNGNIGYRLLSSVPIRKDKTPFIGSRLLDGTTTAYDWTGEFHALRDLPKSLNPKKGYLVTANGRQTSDHAKLDLGASINSPARVLRIDEILREGVESGKKFTLSDLGAIQQDVVDIIARRMVPKILDIIKDFSQELTSEEVQNLEPMIEILQNWQGSFDETSIGASLYMRWYIQFIRSLFIKFASVEDDRMALTDHYHFTDVFQIIITSILEEKSNSRFQAICEGANENYKGTNFCANNIVMALLQAKDFLSTNVSANPQNWIWRNLHVNQYKNLPWSSTPLKFLFHKTVPVPGNKNTPNVSKISERENKDSAVISSSAAAGLKMLIQLAKDPKDDVSLISIDTGINAHPFQGNFFDFNKDFLAGKLMPLKWNAEKLQGTRVNTLTLRPTTPSKVIDVQDSLTTTTADEL